MLRKKKSNNIHEYLFVILTIDSGVRMLEIIEEGNSKIGIGSCNELRYVLQFNVFKKIHIFVLEISCNLSKRRAINTYVLQKYTTR